MMRIHPASSAIRWATATSSSALPTASFLRAGKTVALGRSALPRSNCDQFYRLARRRAPTSGPSSFRPYLTTTNDKVGLQDVAGGSTVPTSASLAAQISQEHRLPLFRVRAQQVTLLERPSDFYKTLLAIIQRARRHIVLTSLYIGKSENELIDALADALTTHTGLHVTILVDSLRSTREGEYTGEASSESCASLLAGLQSAFPERVHIRMYRAPGLPRWLEKLVGKRFVEGWGLQHMKIYAGDDEVMISGANLSNDYFTNRRDRYILLKDASLSEFLCDVAMKAARYSYALHSDAVENPTKDGGAVAPRRERHARYRLEWDEDADLPVQVTGQSCGSQNWKGSLRHILEQSVEQWAAKQQRQHSESDDGTVEIVPMLQMGPLGITHETTVVPHVMSMASLGKDHRLNFTTGYFSINPLYAERILTGTFACDIIAAAPQANGFFGSKGVSKYLPPAYTWLMHRFWRALARARRDDKVTISEWMKPGWTYHAKGIWLYGPHDSSPSATLLGSTNFGTRSAQLDLECTLLIDASKSDTIKNRLGEEFRELAHDASPVDRQLFKRPERVVPLGVKLAARIIRKML